MPASQWSSADRLAVSPFIPETLNVSRHMEDLATRAGNGYVEDFAALGAQYLRGFSAALPRYTTADSYLYATATRLIQAINAACRAVGG
jgi:hypothetical protein